MLTGVVPVRVTGDGNCLFHAVSRALEEANVEYMYPTSNKSLRARAAAELLSNKIWYAEQIWQHALDVSSQCPKSVDRG